MSLADKINANTQAVLNGKTNIASAIINKGGTVATSGSVSTFSELVAGINSIETGGSGGGGEEENVLSVSEVGIGEAEVLASSYMSRGDTCALVQVQGEWSSSVAREYPTHFKIESTSYTIPSSSSYYPFSYQDGDYLLIPCTTNPKMFLFYWTGEKYEQLKVEGVYDSLFMGNSSVYSLNESLAFEGDLLYRTNSRNVLVYTIDKENLNITLKQTLSYVLPSAFGYWTRPIVHNHNLWVTGYNTNYANRALTYQLYYDEENGTLTGVQWAGNGVQTHSTTQKEGVYDFTFDGQDNAYLYVSLHSGFRIRKMTMNSSGIYQFTSDLNLGISVSESDMYSSYQASTVFNPNVRMTAGCGAVLAKTSSNELKFYSVDTDTMVATEVTYAFGGEIDLTAISGMSFAKDAKILFLKSATDSTVTMWYFDTNDYKLLGSPSTFCSDAIPEGTLPYSLPYENLTTKRTPFLTNIYSINIYDISIKLAHDYIAYHCNNVLTEPEGCAGYGVIMEDVEENEVGIATLLFIKQ